jgi:hypothetical protein
LGFWPSSRTRGGSSPAGGTGGEVHGSDHGEIRYDHAVSGAGGGASQSLGSVDDNGCFFATAGIDGVTRVWRVVESGGAQTTRLTCVAVLESHTAGVRAVAMPPPRVPTQMGQTGTQLTPKGTKPYTLNPQSSILNHKPGILNPS